MQDIVNPLQSTSYVNKDFTSIYTELLDLVHQLTSKWDPSNAANESDPGVILLKLNALIADKCNYNIDKNVLECFPLSVTQETNAKQLYEQLGYYMHWYQSAKTVVSMAFTGESDKSYFTIPPFTMVSDADDSIVYTLVGPYDGIDLMQDKFDVDSCKLKCDGSIISFQAIQGIAVQLDINNTTLITPQHLDSNHRIYFPTTDIAQNGIFITNYGKNNYSDWEQRDNLLVETLNNKYYKFGVTQDEGACYLEFPEDAETLFGEGINIIYIKTSGAYGNIPINTLSKFYNDLVPIEDGSITLNSDNVRIMNYYGTISGKDKETINEAYTGYKRTVGTFDTLITLRDYCNAVVKSKLVSNGFVCDRTNDIQQTYRIISSVNGISQPITVVEKSDAINNRYSMNAFDLKLYLLNNVDDTSNVAGYKQSFNIVSQSYNSVVQDYLNDLKCIGHDFSDIEPSVGACTELYKETLYNVGDVVCHYDSDTDKTKYYKCIQKINVPGPWNLHSDKFIEIESGSHFCYFQNRYPLNITIYTNVPFEINDPRIDEIKENIKKALYTSFDANSVEFGDGIDPVTIKEVILKSDYRIKDILIDSLQYRTYAVYYDGKEFKELEINSDDTDRVTLIYDANKFNQLTCDADKFIKKVGYCNYGKIPFRYNGNKWYIWNPGDDSSIKQVSLSDYGINIPSSEIPQSGDQIVANVSLKSQFRDEIYAKSVLAGKTQLYVKDEEFDYKLNQSFIPTIDDDSNYYKATFIEKVKTNVKIKLDNSNAEYKLKDNENIQLYSPNLLQSDTFSNYVKYEYYIREDVKSNTNYKLKENEYVILYWESTVNDELYNYRVYGKGNIIHSTFEMPRSTGQASIYGIELTQKMRNVGTYDNEILQKDSNIDGMMSLSLAEKIHSIVDANHILSGTKEISIKVVNNVVLNTNYRCYWILNDTVDDVNGEPKYRLFEKDGANSRLLNNGEYFIYTNKLGSNMTVLGAGTKLTRSNNSKTWDVSPLGMDSIYKDGISSLINYWFYIDVDTQLKAIENKYITVGPQCYFKLRLENTTALYSGFELSEFSGGIQKGNITINRSEWASFAEYNGDKIKVNDGYFVFNYQNEPKNWIVTLPSGEESQLSNINSAGIYIDKSVALTDGVRFKLHVKYQGDWSVEINYDDTDGVTFIPEQLSLDDFVISYKENELDDYTDIERNQLKNSNEKPFYEMDGWKCRSLLSFSISPTNQFILLDNQSLSYHILNEIDVETGEDIYHKIDGENLDTETHLYPKCILSSLSIASGGSPLTSTYTEENDVKTYLSLYLFKQHEDDIEHFIEYNSDGDILLYFYYNKQKTYEQGTKYNEASFKFRLPKGNYMIPFLNSHPELSNVNVYYIKNNKKMYLHSVYRGVQDEESEDFSDAKQYYIYYESDGEEHEFFFHIENQQSDLIIQIYNCYKFIKPYRLDIDNISDKWLLSDEELRMNELQYENFRYLVDYFDSKEHLFNYINEVNENYGLQNPLSSSSFINANHIYNKFTICEIDPVTDGIKFTVVNRNR